MKEYYFLTDWYVAWQIISDIAVYITINDIETANVHFLYSSYEVVPILSDVQQPLTFGLCTFLKIKSMRSNWIQRNWE
jgi:hypothetical protein